MDRYLKMDVLLLADVFESFRKVSHENYGLDPAWYYTAPGLTYDAALKITEVELELLSDPDMALMIGSSIRGGICMVSKRYSKANNKYLKGKVHDKTKPSTYIPYLDANNLYGWAMMRKLPVGRFEWMTADELTHWQEHSCFLEVDLEYPEELHDLHNDYPLAPERMTVWKVQKLVPNLNNETKYVLHHDALKFNLSCGLKLTKIHRGIKFIEKTG
jgi:hypothetical protein